MCLHQMELTICYKKPNCFICSHGAYIPTEDWEGERKGKKKMVGLGNKNFPLLQVIIWCYPQAFSETQFWSSYGSGLGGDLLGGLEIMVRKSVEEQCDTG